MMVRQKPVGGDTSLINVNKVQHSTGSFFLAHTKLGDNKYLFKFIYFFHSHAKFLNSSCDPFKV